METRFFKAVTRSLILYQEKKQQGDNLVTVCLTVYWSCEICIIDQPQGQCGWILTIFFFWHCHSWDAFTVEQILRVSTKGNA